VSFDAMGSSTGTLLVCVSIACSPGNVTDCNVGIAATTDVPPADCKVRFDDTDCKVGIDATADVDDDPPAETGGSW